MSNVHDATDFAVADIVRLRSGGPQMTVEHIGTWGRRTIRTVWLTAHASYTGRDRFDPRTLEKVL